MTASANHSISQTGLKRRSVVLMIVFAILTFSFYYPIWFLRRRTALNQLDSPRKLRLWPFVVCLASVAVQFVWRSGPRGSSRPSVPGRRFSTISFNSASLSLWWCKLAIDGQFARALRRVARLKGSRYTCRSFFFVRSYRSCLRGDALMLRTCAARRIELRIPNLNLLLFHRVTF